MYLLKTTTCKTWNELTIWTYLVNQGSNIGPIVQGVHSAYEPPITLQIPVVTDDSPDDDGTIESLGSKSIGSSPSSSHSDMSSPMFKPESLIVRIYNLVDYFFVRHKFHACL